MRFCINLCVGTCKCRKTHHFTLPVPDAGTDARVRCELNWRGDPGDTLQVLTPGHTYNRSYWDFPYRPKVYSFVESAVDAGYTTLSYDHLGTGSSFIEHVSPDQLSVHLHALALGRIVDAVRCGGIPKFKHKFKHIVSVGHSLGSNIALRHAGLFPGSVDKLIITGTMRNVSPEFPGLPNHPATSDRKFSSLRLPDWIITSQFGARDVFYLESASESQVRYVDEGLKDVGALAEIATLDQAYELDGRITIPALYVIGDTDAIWCGSQSACATKWDILDRIREFGVLPNASIEAVVIGGTGHSLNLHVTAQQTFSAINNGSMVK